MYYSKSNAPSVTLPRNYSGNAFSHEDEEQANKAFEDNTYIEDAKSDRQPEVSKEAITKNEGSPILPSLFSSISVEDLLLLGLIFVIHQENPNDSTLLLLLILLLAK